MQERVGQKRLYGRHFQLSCLWDQKIVFRLQLESDWKMQKQKIKFELKVAASGGQ